MPFIGNQPALSYTSFAKQDFTTSATTSYTLNNPVANANELALFINFVRQEPTTAYSASGTSLTLTSATSASDDMYCVYLGKAVQTVNPPNASVGISQLSATGTKDATTFLRGDNTFASAGGANIPAFYAYAAAQSIPNSTNTKINLPSTLLDTNSAVASNKFTVPSGEAGTYFLSAQCGYNSASDWDVHFVKIFKNGSQISKSSNRQEYDTLNNTSVITNLSVGDYIELYVEQGSGSSQNLRTPSSETYLQGFKLIT